MNNEEIKITIDRIETNEELPKETCLQRLKRKTKELASLAYNYAYDNPEKVGSGIVAGIAGIAWLKKATRKTSAEIEYERKIHTYYDPSTGLHWQLKRPFTNRERIELETRRKRGEFVGDILSDMRILRR